MFFKCFIFLMNKRLGRMFKIIEIWKMLYVEDTYS